jgi:hypothetical protein
MSLHRLRTLATDTGDALTDAAATLGRLAPDATAFPAGAPGRLGELAHALHTQLGSALAARAREAAAHGARFADAAAVLRLAAAGYADTDAEVRRRHQDGDT